MSTQFPVEALMVNVTLPVEPSVTEAEFVSWIIPIVSVGTFVIVAEDVTDPSNRRMSSAAGVVRVGVQLASIAHDPLPPPLHV
jgi:hypothetical protein